ncbi:glycosyltransferase family 4 protein [Chryseobacterium sp.]|uniref:glycosyltransferase family 4 protein n=1 Tax=Chryseobacterium sp. TaxID=1871047 RepID=UPI00388D0A6E
MKIGIDASRNRSGGARAHIIGVLKEIHTLPSDIKEVHIWSYDALLDLLPNYSWLVKHSPKELDKNILYQLKWQYFSLAKEAENIGIDILLNTDAGTVSRFFPSITMSRDMLSYEPGEMKRFGISFQRLRLEILKIIQNYSLKNSAAAIFLTKYSSDVIQESSGKISNYKIIPHGVSENFRLELASVKNAFNKQKSIKCIYVSNVDWYKHQWNVLEAVTILRDRGFDLEIEFIGGGYGKAQAKFLETLNRVDPNRLFAKQLDFVSHQELPKYLENSDIFIFASSCENMPNTLIEGMCTGLPIVCSDRGPMPEVLKDGGIFFDPENISSIVNALQSLLEDESKRLEISNRSKLLSNQYSWKRCSSETFEYIVEVYKTILNKENGK